MLNLLLLASVVPLLPVDANAGTSLEWTVCVDECGSCSSSKLCKPHQDHEQIELKRLLPGLESEEPRERQEALRDIADITDAHSNSPSAAVAQVLAGALKDKRIVVRETAMELLAHGQHPETAVKAVVDELELFRINMWTLSATLAGPNGEGGTAGDVMRYLGTTMEAAGELRDDRIVAALEKTLKAYPEEMRGQRIAMLAVDSLLELGTQSAVKTVVKQFNGLKDVERAKEVQNSLILFASDHDIEDHPDVDEDWKRPWTAWLNKNKKSFPAKLGKWKGPPSDS